MSENDNEIDFQKKLEKIFKEFKTKAEQGDSQAMLMVGSCYFIGAGVEQDSAKAFEWYKKSADAGNVDAMLMLGGCYQSGLDVKQDLKKAFQYYQKAADTGNASAMLMLGGCYYLGLGVDKDLKQAFQWYKKSAELGNANAMLMLGNYYNLGSSLDKDLEKAFEWYKKAFKAEHSILQLYQTIFALETVNAEDKFKAIDTLRGLERRINDFLKTGKEDDSRPKTIAHYTNWQALWKILGNDEQKGTLRLAPVQYMNDPSEGSFFFKNVGKQAEKTIKYFTGNNLGHSKKKPQDTTDIVSCIASFSENADQLDLWRFYGRDGAGVAIEIEYPKIPEFFNLDITSASQQTPTGQANDTIIIFKISYGKEACQEAYKAIATNLQTLKEFCENNAKEHTDLVIAIKNISSALLSYLSYMFKDTHYENEQEYRLIKILRMDSSELKRDIQNGPPSFYSEIPIEKLKIKKVFIGPNQVAPQKIDLWMQNKQKGLHEFVQSDIPYKPSK